MPDEYRGASPPRGEQDQQPEPRLMAGGLDFVADFWRQPGDRAAEEERRWEANDPIGEILEFKKVLCDYPSLC